MIENKKTEKFNIILINLDGLRRDKIRQIEPLNELIKIGFNGFKRPYWTGMWQYP